MIQLTGEIEVDDIKRLCVEGITIERNCPECDESTEYDFEDRYISYGELSSINFYCVACEHDWDLPAEIVSTNITIEVAE